MRLSGRNKENDDKKTFLSYPNLQPANPLSIDVSFTPLAYVLRFYFGAGNVWPANIKEIKEIGNADGL